jgi:CBS domain containing-hemolysin-like protein
VNTSVEEALRSVAKSHHSRYPVYRDSIDDVIGVLHVRDLVGAEGGAMIESLLRLPLIVPTQASVNELLREMRERKTGPYKTVAGYIVEQVRRIPEVDDSVEIGGYRLTAVEMAGMRIATVEATPVAAVASRDRATE